jgi:hypothetical protein
MKMLHHEIVQESTASFDVRSTPGVAIFTDADQNIS